MWPRPTDRDSKSRGCWTAGPCMCRRSLVCEAVCWMLMSRPSVGRLLMASAWNLAMEPCQASEATECCSTAWPLMIEQLVCNEIPGSEPLPLLCLRHQLLSRSLSVARAHTGACQMTVCGRWRELNRNCRLTLPHAHCQDQNSQMVPMKASPASAKAY